MVALRHSALGLALSLSAMLPAVDAAFQAAPAADRTAWERATGHLLPTQPQQRPEGGGAGSGFLYYDKAAHAHAQATYDGRSMKIDNQSTILLGGSVHYMRCRRPLPYEYPHPSLLTE